MGIAGLDQTQCVQPGSWILQWHLGFCDMWASEQAGRHGMKHYCLPNQSRCSTLWRWDGGPSPLKSVLKCVNLGNVGSRHTHLRLCFATSLTNGLPWRLSLVKNPPANAGDKRDLGSIPGSGRSPGGGNNRHKSLLYLLGNEINIMIN